MNAEEIDKLIAESVEQERKKSRWHRPQRARRHGLLGVRNALNVVFMLGFVAAIVIYFAWPQERGLFFCVGFGAVILKVVEFIIRFMA